MTKKLTYSYDSENITCVVHIKSVIDNTYLIYLRELKTKAGI